MLKINNENIIKVYIGSTPLSNIYVNDYIVMSSTIDLSLYKFTTWQPTTNIDGTREIVNEGSSNNMTLYGGQGTYFNGANQYHETGITSAEFFNPNNDFTIAFWSKSLTNNKGYFNFNINQLQLSMFGYFSDSFPTRLHFGSSATLNLGDTLAESQEDRHIEISRSGNSISFYVNGSFKVSHDVTGVTIGTTTNFEIGKIGSSNFFHGYQKDWYIYNRTLTEAERTKMHNQPEQFFMDAKNDATCLLNMPMTDTDWYARDYSSYSELLTIQDNGTKTSTAGNTRITQVTQGLLFEAGKSYLISYSFDYVSSISNFRGYIPPSCRTSGIAVSITIVPNINGEVNYIMEIPDDYITTDGNSSFYFWLEVDGTPTTTDFSDISVKQLSGIHPIENATNDTKDLAKNLQYGLQTPKLVTDSLGVVESVSPWFEGNGVSYGDAGWIPNADEDWSIEIIQFLGALDGNSHYHGYYESSGENRIFFGDQENNLNFYVRLGSSSTSISNSVRGYHHFSMTFNHTLKTLSLYKNGVYQKDIGNGSFGGCNGSMFIGGINGLNNRQVTATRLFKVHDKALTQEEITTAYNDAVNKGLLS